MITKEQAMERLGKDCLFYEVSEGCLDVHNFQVFPDLVYKHGGSWYIRTSEPLGECCWFVKKIPTEQYFLDFDEAVKEFVTLNRPEPEPEPEENICWNWICYDYHIQHKNNCRLEKPFCPDFIPADMEKK